MKVVEIGDAIIRSMDYDAGFELRVAEAIVRKMRHNRKRPYRHGKLS